jgi:hypothetical protein
MLPSFIPRLLRFIAALETKSPPVSFRLWLTVPLDQASKLPSSLLRRCCKLCQQSSNDLRAAALHCWNALSWNLEELHDTELNANLAALRLEEERRKRHSLTELDANDSGDGLGGSNWLTGKQLTNWSGVFSRLLFGLCMAHASLRARSRFGVFGKHFFKHLIRAVLFADLLFILSCLA